MEELDRAATKRDVVEMGERLIEAMRTMQTELLRGVDDLISG